MAWREEHWTRDGRTCVVEVSYGVVEVSYELLAGMLTELGFSREEPEQ